MAKAGINPIMRLKKTRWFLLRGREGAILSSPQNTLPGSEPRSNTETAMSHTKSYRKPDWDIAKIIFKDNDLNGQ